MNDSNFQLTRNLPSALVQASVIFLFAISFAHAGVVLQELTVTSSADSGPGTLRSAIEAAHTHDSIEFDCSSGALKCPATIQLSSQGNGQAFPGPTALAIKGKSITIKGPPGGVTLQAVPGVSSATSLRHFFVDSDASLTLQNVLLSDGLALGGDGGSGSCGGGGGAGLGGAIFSQGDLTLKNVSFANNNAMGGNGGAALSTVQSYGGGGGLGGDGGSQNNGGGGGTGGDGLTGSAEVGGLGGAGLNGAGGGIGSSGVGDPGIGGGGGGGGYNGGGTGSEGGGGGGGASGGAGGFGGGGGGARDGGSGIGGFGGGGGAALSGGSNGGIGGGLGNCLQNGGSGGGAAAFGGAVFVRSGGTLRVEETNGTSRMADNVVIGGNGTSAGAGAGNGIFLMSGVPAVFDIAGSYTINNDIADDSEISLPAGRGFTSGSGTGAGITKQGSGTLILAGGGNYAGATSVQDGVLRVTGNINASAINVAASGIFTGAGTTGPIDAFGTVAPGTAANVPTSLAPSSLRLEHGALTCFHASGNSVSRLDVHGAAQLNGVAHIDFASGPTVGQTFTLVQASSTAGTFSGYETNMQNLYGVLEYTGTTATFRVTDSDEIFDGAMEKPVIDGPCATAFAQ